jgi:predicted DNA-binding transcriptional regulator AlpA
MIAPQTVNVPELAPIIRKSESWIYKQVAAGLLPHHRQGRSIYFTTGDVNAIFENAARPTKRAGAKRDKPAKRPAPPPEPAKPSRPALTATAGDDIPQPDPNASRKYRPTP